MTKTEERFWSNVKHKPGGCWEWTSYRHNQGYGLFKIKKTSYKAHRVSYEMEYGPIPNGMCVCHKCDNPPCVNPKHLFLGTQKDNMQDAANKGRLGKSKGSKNGWSKLTEKQVVAIRKDTRLHREIAKDYNVTRSVISGIKRRYSWKHVR